MRCESGFPGCWQVLMNDDQVLIILFTGKSDLWDAMLTFDFCFNIVGSKLLMSSDTYSAIAIYFNLITLFFQIFSNSA